LGLPLARLLSAILILHATMCMLHAGRTERDGDLITGILRHMAIKRGGHNKGHRNNEWEQLTNLLAYSDIITRRI